MIGYHDREPAFVQHSPECEAVAFGAKWRRAFSDAAEAVEVILHIEEVVRACLVADVDTTCLSVADQLSTLGGAYVHDVEPAPGLTSEIDDAQDSFHLGLGRPRADEVARTRAGHLVRMPLDHLLVLGVHEEDR